MLTVLYWLGFAIAAICVFCGPAVCARLEERADERDAELWAGMPGATR